MKSVIERIISRKDALVLEDKFFQQAEMKLQATEGVWSPADNRFYKVGEGTCVRRDSSDSALKELLKEQDIRNAVLNYIKMPKNRMMLYEVCHKVPKVALAFASHSPLEELLNPGYTSRKGGIDDINRITKGIAVNPYLFYYIAIFSTTGWSAVTKNSSCLAGNNFVVALGDYYSGVFRTYYAPSELWNVNYTIFEFAAREDKIKCVKSFIKSHTLELILGEMTEDKVLAEAGFDTEIIREAFSEIAQEEDYIRFNRRQNSLSRVY